uniref:Uncharacterized protein n=1 Tax=Plectus sambesii TaxID=2011161 RepID=A0A914V3I6_9BILA
MSDGLSREQLRESFCGLIVGWAGRSLLGWAAFLRAAREDVLADRNVKSADGGCVRFGRSQVISALANVYVLPARCYLRRAPAAALIDCHIGIIIIRLAGRTSSARLTFFFASLCIPARELRRAAGHIREPAKTAAQVASVD